MEKQLNNNFSCPHIQDGSCNRYMTHCMIEACPFYGKCSSCEYYMIPREQEPCKDCSFLERRAGE